MSSNRNVQVTIRQYLLGQLTGDNLEQFEQQLFSDDNLFEEILVAEDELIEESIAGELNQSERDLFAKSFLNTPEGKQKLLFRRVLKNYARQKNQRRQPVPTPKGFWFSLFHSFRTAVASAALIIMTVLGGLIWTMQPSTFATIDLAISSSVRAPGAPATKVKLPLDVDELRLKLALPEPSTPAPSYRVELVKANGEKGKLKTITRDEKSVVVAISASQLEPGQYALNLYATKPGEAEQRIAGSYYFTAE